MNESIKYKFEFQKNFELEKKTKLQLITDGNFTVSMKSEKNDSIEPLEYIFNCDNFSQKGVKDPLVINPVKWDYNFLDNTILIKSKQNIELIWKKYRDKHRRPENQASFLVNERLFFHTTMGLEYYSFSTHVYLPFFINYAENIAIGDIVNGLDWLLIPINLPVKTTFQCKEITNTHILFSGWLSLDDDKLDELLTKERFREKAKDYHFSKDFNIDSQISIYINKETSYLQSATFNLEIKGEKGSLSEMMKYKVEQQIKADDTLVSRIRIIDPY